MICREAKKKTEPGEYGNTDVAVFQSPVWLQNVKESGSEVISLEFQLDSEVVGFISGIKVQSKYAFLNKITKSLYFFSGPILFEGQDHLRDQCYISLSKYSKENGYFGIGIGCYDYPHNVNFSDLGYTKVDRIEYIIDLTPDVDNIFRRFKKSQRTRIRRLECAGLEFSIGTNDRAVDYLLECLGETKKRKEESSFGDYSVYYMPFLSESKVKKLVDNGTCKIFSVKSSGNVISSTLCMTFNNRAYAILNGTTTDGYTLGVPAYIHWRIIQYLKSIGVNCFNLGGLPKDKSGENLAVFKESLGAKPYPCSGGSIKISQSLALNLLARGYTYARYILPFGINSMR
jgi:hypothetical protein